MSPDKKKKLNILRSKLDKIDDSLLILIKKRTNVLKLKTFKYQIVDKKRINIILKRIKNKSLILKIDPKITKTIWVSMIRSYINFEKKNFKKK